MKRKIPYLKSAVALPGYKLEVQFEDGTAGIVELEKWKGKGVFSFWNEERNFRKFVVNSEKKLAWSDEIEMDPDAFYLELVGQTFEEYAGNRQLLRDNH